MVDTPDEIEEVSSQYCRECGCCNCDYAPRRRGGNAITFGRNIRTIAIFLSVVQCMPYERSQSLFAKLFHVSISQGTLANIVHDCVDCECHSLQAKKWLPIAASPGVAL